MTIGLGIILVLKMNIIVYYEDKRMSLPKNHAQSSTLWNSLCLSSEKWEQQRSSRSGMNIFHHRLDAAFSELLLSQCLLAAPTIGNFLIVVSSRTVNRKTGHCSTMDHIGS